MVPSPADAPVFRRRARDKVELSAIRRWNDLIGAAHPATETSLAPPALLHAWTLPAFAPAPERRPSIVEYLRDRCRQEGLDGLVAVTVTMTHLRDVRVDEWLTDVSRVTAISEPRTTRVGRGRFLTTEHTLVDDAEQVVGRQELSLFAFDARVRDDRPRERSLEPAGAVVLTVPVTAGLIVGGALASNDHEPIHHDAAWAREHGVDDIIMNQMTTCGLVHRVALDGTAARVRRTRMTLASPCRPGDQLAVSRRVEEDGSVRVEARHARGVHASALVTLTDDDRG